MPKILRIVHGVRTQTLEEPHYSHFVFKISKSKSNRYVHAGAEGVRPLHRRLVCACVHTGYDCPNNKLIPMSARREREREKERVRETATSF